LEAAYHIRKLASVVSDTHEFSPLLVPHLTAHGRLKGFASYSFAGNGNRENKDSFGVNKKVLKERQG
jgi:hypothetical protein